MNRKWSYFIEKSSEPDLKQIASIVLDNCLGITLPKVQRDPAETNLMDLLDQIGSGVFYPAMDFIIFGSKLQRVLFMKLVKTFLGQEKDEIAQKNDIFLQFLVKVLQKDNFYLKYFIQSGGLKVVLKKRAQTQRVDEESISTFLRASTLVEVLTEVEREHREDGPIFKDEKMEALLKADFNYQVWLKFVQFQYEKNFEGLRFFDEIFNLLKGNYKAAIKIDDFNAFCFHKIFSVSLANF